MQTSFHLSCQCRVTVIVDEDTGKHKYSIAFHKNCNNSLPNEHAEIEENTGMKVNKRDNTLIDTPVD
jgi:hypothetical protein